MALSISAEPSITTEGCFILTFNSNDNHEVFYKISAVPTGIAPGHNLKEYIFGGVYNTSQLGSLHTDSRSFGIPASVRSNWFSTFGGGSIQITVTYSSSKDFIEGETTTLTANTMIYGFFASNKIGVALTEVKDTRSNSYGVKYIRGVNTPSFSYIVVPLDGVLNTNVISSTITYDLVETKTSISKTTYNNGVKCTVSFSNITSPNINFRHAVEYQYNSGFPNYTTNTATAEIKMHYAIQMTDYQQPSIYYDITTPLSPEGKLTIHCSGRIQKYINNYTNSVKVTYELTEIKVGSDYQLTGTLTTSSDNNGVFSADHTFTNLNYQSTYLLIVKVTDGLSGTASASVRVISTPVFDWNSEDFNFNVPVYHQENLTLIGDKSINGVTGNYGEKAVFTPQDSSGNTVIGYDNYKNEQGNTLIYGNNVDILANGNITINGKSINNPEWKSLWTGNSLMGESDSITFSTPVSELTQGITLVFSGRNTSGVTQNSSFNTFFIPKTVLNSLISSGGGTTFLMAINAGLSVFASKYLYFTDTGITGHSGNTSAGTAASNITFDNNRFVLRFVHGY